MLLKIISLENKVIVAIAFLQNSSHPENSHYVLRFYDLSINKSFFNIRISLWTTKILKQPN
jgi:hypothetical protein